MRNKMLLTPKCKPRASRVRQLLQAASSISVVLAISSLVVLTSPTLADSPNASTSASNQNTNQTHSLQQSTSSSSAQSGKISGTDSKAAGKTGMMQQQITIVEQQQPTDISSMYVQIPIAEPGDTGVPDGVQQTLTSTGEADSNGAAQDPKATTWTGPWPKKFQIGYIKQSDLHQVLIESLKNDPFVALGSPAAAAAATAKAGSAQQLSTPSPASTSKVAPKSPEVAGSGAQNIAHWPQSSTFGNQQKVQPNQQLPMRNNLYHHSRPSMKNFRDTSSSLLQPFHMAHNRFQHQMNNLQAQNQPIRQVFNQQPQKLLSIAGNMGFPQQQQQAQYQFGFPMGSFKNEPIYTINNYPHQEQLDQNSMQLVMPVGQQFGQPGNVIGRPHKSTEYLSSAAWRPVTNGEPTQPVQRPQQAGGDSSNQVTSGQFQTLSADYQTLNDGFDDGFSAPNKDVSSGDSMNRHPMLSSYLSSLEAGASGNRSARMSPSMQAKAKQQQTPAEGTKTADGSQSATKASSKGGSIKSAAGAKGAPDGAKNLSVNKRRAQNGTSTTTMASVSSTSASSPSTGEPGEPANASTTMAPPPSVTSGALPITTTTVEGETQEPDSEVIDSDTTEQPATTSTQTTLAAPSTSAAGNQQNPQQQEAQTSTTMASTTSGLSEGSSTSADGQESEVVTQGGLVQQANAGNLPSLAMAGEQPARSSTASSANAGSSREETTPTSRGGTGDGSAKGEVEGSSSAAAEAKPSAIATAKMDSMSDEALLAASLRTAAEIGKTTTTTTTSGTNQLTGQQSITRASAATSGSSSKKTRSPERLVQSPVAASSRNEQLAQPRTSNGSRKSAASSSSKSTAKRPSQSGSNRLAKQVDSESPSLGVKGAKLSTSGKSNGKAAKKASSLGGKSKTMAASRSSNQQSERLVQQPQVVSMSAAQAQSTAQTLASLLLSRCLSSSTCAHLLDICTTKQAMVPLGPLDAPASSPSTTSPTGQQSAGNQSSALAWSMPVGLMSSSIMSLTQALQADRVLKLLPQWKDAIENIVDHDTQTGYTLILPSNEALERLPPATLDQWLANSELLGQLIDNHILDSAELIEFMPSQNGGARPSRSRIIRNKGLQVNQHREKMVTINGKRLVYANQAAPSGGRIHVIDGFLDWPLGGSGASGNGGSAKLLDIMDTLKQCDKFDGFVTLAEGTGLTQILKQDGPMTVFVPSNEALRKIPDEELEVIKNNSTALKEFLMYHVVNGSYFSQDLRDGQQLASILDMKPIQVGVRVDGCSRRLVEANTSPMRRPDIVAKNGVIHILDWYLTIRDNEWCEPIGKFTAPSTTSERLQQLASETEGSYATRIAMPINHKPAISSGQLNEGLLIAQSVEGNGSASPKQLTVGPLAAAPVSGNMVTSDTDNAHNIIVTPSPLSSADSLIDSRISA